MQNSDAAQHVGRVFKAFGIYIESSVIGKNCSAKSHPWSLADGNQARITAVYQIIPEHQPEVSRMVQNKGDKGEAHRPNIVNDVLRVTGFLDVSIRPFEPKYGHFCE